MADYEEDIYSRLFDEYCIDCHNKNNCFFVKDYEKNIINMSIQCENIEELEYEIKLDNEE